MIKPLKFDKTRVALEIQGNFIYYQCKNNIKVVDFDGSISEKFRIPGLSRLNVFLNYFSITRRIFRLGVHHLKLFNDKILIVTKNGIFVSNIDNIKFHRLDANFHGSRPLNFSIANNKIIFGEYFRNNDRVPVKIFEIDADLNVSTVFEFKSRSIRHIHNCQYDSYRDHWWILTGDDDSESALWIMKSNYQVIKVLGGSQRFRTVSAIIKKDHIIFPTDSSSEKNYIQSYNIKTNQVDILYELPGCALDAKKIDDLFIVTTVAEPSIVNDTDNVYFYASMDGFKWIKICHLKKDSYPTFLVRITRYSEIKILDTLLNNKYIVAEGRALKGLSHGSLYWDYEMIKKYINNNTT